MAGCEIVMGYRFNPPPNWPSAAARLGSPAGMDAAARVPTPRLAGRSGLTTMPPAIRALLARFRCQAPGPEHTGMGRPMAGQALRRSHQLRSALQVLPSARACPVRAAVRREEKPGIFGGPQRAESLLQENSDLSQESERLRQQVTALLGMSTEELAAEADRARQQVQARVEQARAELAGVEHHAPKAGRSGIRPWLRPMRRSAISRPSGLKSLRPMRWRHCRRSGSMSTGIRCRTRLHTRAAWPISRIR